jgi:adenosine deaminase
VEAVGLTEEEILGLVRNSFEASFLDRESIDRHLALVAAAAES